MKKVAANKAAFVIVDSQYVQELIEILAAERASAFSLTFGAGEAITSAATLRGKAFLTQRFTSTDHTLQLMVRTPSQRYRHTGYKTFLFLFRCHCVFL